MSKTIYIAGPVSGHSEYNFPAFYEADKTLTALGHIIVNPARLAEKLSKDTNRSLDGISQSEYMYISIDALLRCNAIAMLDGWWYSAGATMEYQVANSIGLPIYRYQDGGLIDEKYVPPNILAERQVRTVIRRGLEKHGAESWQNEPAFNHLLKSARHSISHELQRTGWSPQDGESHAANALTRAAMALWQSVYNPQLEKPNDP